jgi:LysM repeat protein
MKKLLLPAGLAAAAVLFSACGDSSTATTSSVLNMSSSNYATLPTTPSTLPPSSTAVGQTVPPGTQTTEITEYTIKDGDVPFTVANKFGITLDALNLANVDTSGYSAFYVGLKIKIPVGATIPSASTDTTTTTTASTPSETTTTLAGGGSNCTQGSYTIVAGDLPGTVATKFDVTVAQLDEANVNTSGYKNFIVGVKIIIPAKDGCTG